MLLALFMAVAGLILLGRGVTLATEDDRDFLKAMIYSTIGMIVAVIGILAFVALFFFGPVVVR